MYQKLFIAYSTAEGDEEFFVTFRLDRLMTFDFVKSTATDMRFLAEFIDAYARYFS